MKKILKRMTAVLITAMCLSLVGCGGAGSKASNPKDCKDWTEGVLEINGGVVVLGKTTIDEFEEVTGFTEELQVNEWDTYHSYYLSDGYSTIEVRTTTDDVIGYLQTTPVVSEDEGFDHIGVDPEHTTVVGPGGITLGVSTVEDLEAYDQNTPNRYNTAITSNEDRCSYIAILKDDNGNPTSDWFYSVEGDPETHVIYYMSIITGDYED